MKILFKTTDRNDANAQLRAFTKSANANLDLRKEAKEINFLTRIITAPPFALEYKDKNIGKFNFAMLVVTEIYSVPVFIARNCVYWFERRERLNKKYTFCAVIYNDKGEYILTDCNDMTAADATEYFNGIDKKRLH